MWVSLAKNVLIHVVIQSSNKNNVNVAKHNRKHNSDIQSGRTKQNSHTILTHKNKKITYNPRSAEEKAQYRYIIIIQ